MFKFCKHCQFVFYRKKYQSDKQWSGVMFCSKSCVMKHKYRNKVAPHNCCECGGLIERRKGQSTSSYTLRKTCSKKCFIIRSKRNKNTFKPGDKHWNWNGGFYVDQRGYKRVLTGVGEYSLEHRIIAEESSGNGSTHNKVVHHKNGDTLDNRKDNLDIMTSSEHARLHWDKLDKGGDFYKKAAISRKKKYSIEERGNWKSNVTEEMVAFALFAHCTQKNAAISIGICADTIRARVKYYKKNGEMTW